MTDAADTAEAASAADAETAPAFAGVAPEKGGPATVADLSMPPGAFMTSDHRYYFNGEGPVPSVTTVIGLMEKPAVMAWAKKNVARAALRHSGTIREMLADTGEDDVINFLVREADRERDTAAKLGSGVHLLADMASRNALRGPVAGTTAFQVSEQEMPYLAAFRGFLGRYGASNIVSSEKIVWSENGYAGTYDLLMQMPCYNDCGGPDGGQTVGVKDGKGCAIPDLWLIDIKTSKGYYPEYGLQLAAYRWADSIILPGDPGVYPMPQVQRTGVLHLRPDQYPDTGWRLVEYPTDYKLDYMPFLGLLEAYQWKLRGRFTKGSLQNI